MANRPLSHGRNRLRLTTTTFLAGFGLIGLPGLAHAGTLPAGGSVAAGSASIASSGANTVITQSSQNAVINWQSFSVGQGNTVTFNDPNAQSATLNRVTGSATSVIAGQIISNGAVYLVNPNGIAITSSGAVQTGGGFVASTLGIADADFMAGRLNFAGSGASQTVSNAGKIIAGQGAYVALLGGAVSNAGTITVPLGRVGLGSGEQVALDLNGSGFMQVAVPTALVTGSHALIDNSGAIVVSGGRVTLSAAAVKNAVRNIINVSGSINADSAVGDGGTITLIGGADTADMAGTVTVSGTLSARATGLTGNGGTVETSGATVDFTGLKVDTSSLGGKTGTWVVDPEGLIVDAAAAATISSNLATTDVLLSTTGNTPVGPGTPITDPYAGASVPVIGTIYINAPITWSSRNTLDVVSVSDVVITAAINGPNGGLTFGGYSGSAITQIITDTAAVNIGTFKLQGGTWMQNMAVLPSFSATDFQIEQEFMTPSTFLRVTGGNGTTSSPYQIADIYGLQGIGVSQGIPNSIGGFGPQLSAASYVLANNIDASVTSTWNNGTGFLPIGAASSGFAPVIEPFTGTFDGQGHTISGLVINNSSFANVGLFGQIGELGLGGTVANLTISSASVTDLSASAPSGVLAGVVVDSTITNVHTSGFVTTAGGNAGGLVGGAVGTTISDSSSSASVTGAVAGGLVSTSGSGTQISQSYATGTVSAVYTGGGLVGSLASGSSISQSYASGAVTGAPGGTSYEKLGGLVGASYSASVDQAYATGSVTGSVAAGSNIDAGGLVGLAQASTITQSYATGAINSGNQGNENAAGGLVGHLVNSTLTTSYWDSYSTGQSAGAGLADSASTSSATSVTSDPAQFAAANYAYNAGTYGGFTSADWVFFNGQTRPFGAWELPTAVNGVITINNSHQLQLISTALGGSFVQGADIDLSETGAVTPGTPSSYAGMWSGAGFVPIGLSYNVGASNFVGTPFTGSFDGKGYAINNLNIDLPGTYNVGLFSGLGGSAQLNAVVLNSAKVIGGSFTGGLVGDILSATSITNNVFSGSVYGQAGPGGGLISGTGGLVGAVYGPTALTANRTFGTVDGMEAVGGLVGMVWNASVSGSASSATVYGTNFAVGGLVGELDWGSIDQGSASGAVTGGGDVGGLVGNMGFTGKPPVTISNSYASGTVSNIPGATFPGYTGLGFGGLVGRTGGGSITDSYASGQVIAPGAPDVGGLVGINDGTPLAVISSYFNVDLNTGVYGTGLTTAQMQDFNAYVSTYSGWDFANIWAPPSQAGQAGQTSSYYPELYALSPVVFTAAAATSKTYGTDNPALLGTVFGGPGIYVFGLGGDSLSSTSLFSTTATAASGVNQYTVTPATGSVNSTLGVVYRVIDSGTAGSLTVTPAPLTITYTANTAQSIYGTTPTGLTGSYSETGLVNGDGLGGSASFTTTATGTSNVGSYGVTGTGLSASSNYTLSSIQAAGNATALTIAPAALTITYSANAAQSTYGTTPTGLTGSYGETGLVNGDALGGSASFTTTATGTSNVGSYGVTGTGLTASSNYTLSSIQAAGNAAALTITPAALTITYTANATQSIYGTTPTGLTGGYGETGLVNGDALGGSASFATTAASTSNVGSYGVTGSGLTASSNYTLSSVQAPGNATALTITPAALTVTYTANAAQSIYGTMPTGLTGGYGETGLVNGDELGGAASFTAGGAATANVGSYGITGAGLTATANYTLSSIQAAGNATALTISPAPLTITYTANAAQSTYGTTPTGLTGSYSETGLVNGDGLGGSASFTTMATGTSNVGSYGVTGSGLTASSNYTLSSIQAAGNATALTINPAALTVTYTASAAQSIYGTTPTGLTGSYGETGLVNGDALGGSASFTAGGAATENVGSHGITGAGLTASSNYTLSSIQAAGNATALTITPAALTVTYTANAAQSIYGTTPTGLTGSYSETGLVNGDALGGSASFTAGGAATENVGSHGITGAGLSASGNYTLSTIQAAGNATALTITPASLTITYTANPLQSIYGTTPASPTGSYGETGLVNGDALSGNASFATAATSTSNVGSYGITGSGLGASSNYTVSSVQAAGNATALTVTPAALTVTYTANPAQSVYGTTPTGLTGSYTDTGLVNGDKLGGSASFTTTATGTSNVGSYGVTGAGLSASSNYTLSSIQAAGNATALTITPAALTITYTANTAQSIYGTTPTGLTGSYTDTGLVNGDKLGGSASFTTTATSVSDVGTYGVTGAGLTASGNYSLSVIQAPGNATALTIAKRVSQSLASFVPYPALYSTALDVTPCTPGAISQDMRAHGKVVITGANSGGSCN